MDIGINILKPMKLDEILSSKRTYELPIFQRDYSWSKTEWMELIEDAEKSINNDNQHFFGFMTFKVNDEQGISIIEGQQRLTTITVIISVIRDLLNLFGSNIAEKIDTDFIKSYETFSTSEVKFYRLKLSKYNQSFFQKYIQEISNPEEKIHEIQSFKNINKSKQLIGACYIYYYQYFIDKLKIIDDEIKIEFLANFGKKLLNNFIVVYTEVRDDLAAYNIFQTLNNRGLDLNLSDMIKVYLFQNTNKRLKEVSNKWDEIRSNLDQVNTSDFFRHYWLSAYEVIKGPELLRVIENKINSEFQVITFLNEVMPESENYEALLNPSKSDWKNEEIIEHLEYIQILSKQLTLPILLAMKKQFTNENEFLNALKIIIAFTFRYLTIGDKEHKTFERVLSKIAREIRQGLIEHSDQIRPELKKYDIEDEHFKISFVEKKYGKAPQAKFVLKSLEAYLSKEKEKFSTNITLEHIMPKNPDEEWLEYIESENIDHEGLLQTIGNLTLLNRRPNGQLQNKFITVKKEIFKNCSDLLINQDLAEMETWNVEDINNRSFRFAEFANELWKI